MTVNQKVISTGQRKSVGEHKGAEGESHSSVWMVPRRGRIERRSEHRLEGGERVSQTMGEEHPRPSRAVSKVTRGGDAGRGPGAWSWRALSSSS